MIYQKALTVSYSFETPNQHLNIKYRWESVKRKRILRKTKIVSIWIYSGFGFNFNISTKFTVQFVEHQNVHNILQNSEPGEKQWFGQDGQDSYSTTHWLWFWIFLFYSEFKCEDRRSVILIGGFLLWSRNQGRVQGSNKTKCYRLLLSNSMHSGMDLEKKIWSSKLR